MQAKDDGIHARNQDFIRYEQVEKHQEYHLAEDAQEQFDEEFQIRTCDMRSATFACDLGEALHEIGFAILEGHGIDPVLYDDAEKKIVEMFERLSFEEKMRFRAQRHGSVNQGYFPIHETSKQHPDLVEGWVFCRRAFDFPSPGPSGHPLPVGEGSREHEPSPLGEGAAERRVRGGKSSPHMSGSFFRSCRRCSRISDPTRTFTTRD